MALQPSQRRNVPAEQQGLRSHLPSRSRLNDPNVGLTYGKTGYCVLDSRSDDSCDVTYMYVYIDVRIYSTYIYIYRVCPRILSLKSNRVPWGLSVHVQCTCTPEGIVSSYPGLSASCSAWIRYLADLCYSQPLFPFRSTVFFIALRYKQIRHVHVHVEYTYMLPWHLQGVSGSPGFTHLEHNPLISEGRTANRMGGQTHVPPTLALLFKTRRKNVVIHTPGHIPSHNMSLIDFCCCVSMCHPPGGWTAAPWQV